MPKPKTQSSTRYVVKTPNEGFSGKTLGVRFNDGVAVVDSHTVPENFGRTPEQVAAEMSREFGYEVVPEGNGSVHTVPDLSEIKGTLANKKRQEILEEAEIVANLRPGKE